MTASIKVYDVPNFPNPLRVRMALGEKKALESVEFVPVDVMSGEHRTAGFLEKNPAAGIPVMELADGTCLTECSAIIEYIDQSFEGPSLNGVEPKQRAIIHMMQRRAEFMVLDAVAAYFHHATSGLGPDLETHQIREWGEKQKATALAGMHYFNKVLTCTTYVSGDDYSSADIALFAGLVFADFAALEVPKSCEYLIRWKERVAARG